MLVGAGLEHATKIGHGLRVEVISFDSDAQYAQLGWFTVRVEQHCELLPGIRDEKIVVTTAAAIDSFLA